MGVVATVAFSGASHRAGPADIYPTVPGALNPDITQATIGQTICNPNWSTKSIRPPSSYTTALKIKQLKALGWNDQTLSDYEEDHAVALTDGGNPTDPNNLWPMKYPMAREKDKYEIYVHEQICKGEITLAEGQHRLATDWYKWYQQAGLDKQKYGSIETVVDEDDNG